MGWLSSSRKAHCCWAPAKLQPSSNQAPTKAPTKLQPSFSSLANLCPAPSHRASFALVRLSVRAPAFSCEHLRLFLPRETCERPWGWPKGGEFWASSARLVRRPRAFWADALAGILTGAPSSSSPQSSPQAGGVGGHRSSRGRGVDDDAAAAFPRPPAAPVVSALSLTGRGAPLAAVAATSEPLAPPTAPRRHRPPSPRSPSPRSSPSTGYFDDPKRGGDVGGSLGTLGKSAASAAAEAAAAAESLSARSFCFETLWHHVLGEHLYHYQPP